MGRLKQGGIPKRVIENVINAKIFELLGDKIGIDLSDIGPFLQLFMISTDEVDKEVLKSALKSLPVKDISDDCFDELMTYHGMDIIRTKTTFSDELVLTCIRKLIRLINKREEYKEAHIKRFGPKSWSLK